MGVNPTFQDWKFINLEKYRRVSTLGWKEITRHIDGFICGTPSMRENLKRTMPSNSTCFPERRCGITERMWVWKSELDSSSSSDICQYDELDWSLYLQAFFPICVNIGNDNLLYRAMTRENGKSTLKTMLSTHLK